MFPVTPIQHASLTSRFFAGFIDYTIVFAITFALILTFGEPNGTGGQDLTGFMVLLPTSFWFIVIVGIEQLTGATIGNGMLGLRPMTGNGRNKPDFFQSLKRHLLDPVDMVLFGIPAVIAISNTANKQRLGDLWAKTIVVKAG